MHRVLLILRVSLMVECKTANADQIILHGIDRWLCNWAYNQII